MSDTKARDSTISVVKTITLENGTVISGVSGMLAECCDCGYFRVKRSK